MCRARSRDCEASSASTPLEVVRVSLFKDPVYEDFGFSVSDGLYERGVFINRIRLDHMTTQHTWKLLCQN
jgi:hypothetical protein